MIKLSHNEIIDMFPTIKLNAAEPFELMGIGYTIIDRSKKSPSFDRIIKVDDQTACVVEYALYWNYDIEHLYDLEHIWLYLDHGKNIIKCEVSFHGKVINGLSPANNRSNEKLFLYCQAGKHAFAPTLGVFEALENYRTATCETVGKDGLLITPVLENRMTTSFSIDESVKKYMQKFKFRLSETYYSVDIPEILFMPWAYLNHEIPQMLKEELSLIQYHEMLHKKEVYYV